MTEPDFTELDRLIRALSSDDRASADRAKESLKSLLKNDQTVEFLIQTGVSGPDPSDLLASGAVSALCLLGQDSRLSRKLLERMASSNSDERYRAAYIMKNIPQRDAFEGLKTFAADDPDENTKICCLHALMVLTLSETNLELSVAALFIAATKDKSFGVRHAGFECLSHMKDPSYESVLRAAANDSHHLISSSVETWIENHRSNH